MKFRKLATAALAGAMAMSLTVPAFAAGTTNVEDINEGASVEIVGETKAPTIKITVPTTGSVIVNPYRLEVGEGSAAQSGQVISAPQYIVNGSDVGLKVSATVTGTVAGNAVLAKAAIADTDTTNSVFMYFEIKTVADDSATPTWGAAYDADDDAQILVGENEATTEDIVELENKSGTTSKAAVFHFAGEANDAPETPWTADDTVGVNLVFTFSPVANAETPAGGGGGSTTP